MLKAKLIAAYTILRLPRLQNRTSKNVKQDYNDTSWHKIAFEIRKIFTQAPNTQLPSLLNNPIIEPNTRYAVMENYTTADPSTYLNFKANKLISLFKDQNLNILELGCGFGWNLSVLRNSGHAGNLLGVDISETGISLAKSISDKYNLNINYQVLDLTNYAHLKNLIESIKCDIIFTYQVFEQLPHESEALIRSLIKIAKKRSFVLIESSASLKPLNYSDLLSKIYVWKKDYQTILCKTLKDLEQKNIISDLSIQRLRCSHKIGNESAVYRFNSI